MDLTPIFNPMRPHSFPEKVCSLGSPEGRFSPRTAPSDNRLLSVRSPAASGLFFGGPRVLFRVARQTHPGMFERL